MNDQLVEMAKVEAAKQLRIAQRNVAIAQSALDALNDHNTTLKPTWHIFISSAWKNLGSHHEDEKDHQGDYATETLEEAIKRAATDFCVLNHRSYPGHRWHSGTSEHVSDRWDVQGAWYVSLKIGEWQMSLPEESYKHHVQKLKERTDEIWGPERVKLERKKVLKIA
jgi:hypothetical protein